MNQDRAGLLKPRVLVGSMIHYQVNQNANAALLRRVREFDEIAQRSITRVDVVVIGNVIAVISTGRSLKRHEPDCGHAQSVQVIQAPH